MGVAKKISFLSKSNIIYETHLILVELRSQQLLMTKSGSILLLRWPVHALSNVLQVVKITAYSGLMLPSNFSFLCSPPIPLTLFLLPSLTAFSPPLPSFYRISLLSPFLHTRIKNLSGCVRCDWIPHCHLLSEFWLWFSVIVSVWCEETFP